MKTFSDEHIEYWAKIYLANNLYQRGILFDFFLEHPQDILYAITYNTKLPYPESDGFYRLLPIQEKVWLRLEAEYLQEEMDNRFKQQGHVVELHGDRELESMKKPRRCRHWKTNTRRAS